MFLSNFCTSIATSPSSMGNKITIIITIVMLLVMAVVSIKLHIEQQNDEDYFADDEYRANVYKFLFVSLRQLRERYNRCLQAEREAGIRVESCKQKLSEAEQDLKRYEERFSDYMMYSMPELYPNCNTDDILWARSIIMKLGLDDTHQMLRKRVARAKKKSQHAEQSYEEAVCIVERAQKELELRTSQRTWWRRR